MKVNSSGVFIVFVLCLCASPLMAKNIISNFMKMDFVNIPPGEYMMGLKDRDEALLEMPAPETDSLLDELPRHKAVISHSFYMGKTEVTQQQWYRVMENKPGKATLWQREDWKVLPVSTVSWSMAARFVEELNIMDKVYRYRLPTEMEWEYVARSGSNGFRPVDMESLNDHAWYIKNSNDEVQPVATRKANSFGVYDMLGNVWEWVGDWYDKDVYTQANRKDSSGPKDGWSRVRRGGSYHCPVHMIRPGYRSANKPDTRYEVVGFRVVAELKH